MKKDKNLRWFATTKEATTDILNIIATTTGKTSIQLPDISVLFLLLIKWTMIIKQSFQLKKKLENK